MSSQGEAPADAAETAALAKFVNTLAKSAAGAKMFIDWHSYRQLFIFRKHFKLIVNSLILIPHSLWI